MWLLLWRTPSVLRKTQQLYQCLHCHSTDPSRLAVDLERYYHVQDSSKNVSSRSKNEGMESESRLMSDTVGKRHLDARLVGFFILEFGVIFHSVIIGLTLLTTGAHDFNTLFVVIIFHQMFEGLGLGSRLAILPFAKRALLPWYLDSESKN